MVQYYSTWHRTCYSTCCSVWYNNGTIHGTCKVHSTWCIVLQYSTVLGTIHGTMHGAVHATTTTTTTTTFTELSQYGLSVSCLREASCALRSKASSPFLERLLHVQTNNKHINNHMHIHVHAHKQTGTHANPTTRNTNKQNKTQTTNTRTRSGCSSCPRDVYLNLWMSVLSSGYLWISVLSSGCLPCPLDVCLVLCMYAC